MIFSSRNLQILLFLSVLYTINTATLLKCYNCKTEDKGCLINPAASKGTECPKGDWQCATVRGGKNKEEVWRSCVEKTKKCEDIEAFKGDKNRNCTLCASDLCNSEPIKVRTKCYTCKTGDDGCWSNLTSAKEFTCPSGEWQCATIVGGADLHIKNKEIWRSCVKKNQTCDDLQFLKGDKNRNCTLCASDLCNSESVKAPIKCYACTTGDEGCWSTLKSTKEFTCPSNNWQCATIFGGAKDSIRNKEIWRSCVKKSQTCDDLLFLKKDSSRNCTLCDTDLCNSKNGPSSPNAASDVSSKLYILVLAVISSLFVKSV